MRILLTTLNSKYIHSNLALKYLYESAGIYRNLIEIKEFNINNDEVAIYMEIMRGGYDCICFSCYIWNVSKTINLIKDIKKSNQNIRIIVGGPEVSHNTEEFIKACPQVDLVIQGEGDRSFPLILKKIVEEDFSFENKIYPELISQPDNIPFPYEHSEIDKNKIIYYESARGCPYGCSFCLSSTGKGVRFLPIDRVKKELKFFIDRNVTQVKFVDRTFNANVKRAEEILEFIIENDNGITNFHFELCADRLSDDILKTFNRARVGLFQVEIGVQSTCPEALEACNRQVDFDKLSENVRTILSGRNIHLHLDLIAGLPYETYERFKESFNAVYGLGGHNLQLGFLKLIKGTKLRDESEKYGYIFRDHEPYEVISNIYISPQEMIRLKMIESLLDNYDNKVGFKNTLRYIFENNNLAPFDFYEHFSKYYYEKGYHLEAQNRERLYDIFLDFAIENNLCNPEILKELLLYDKIAVAAPSRYTDRNKTEYVHTWLRENWAYKTDMPTKVLIKIINYMTFLYNVEEYAAGKTPLVEKGKEHLLVFFAENKDAAGQACCINTDI